VGLHLLNGLRIARSVHGATGAVLLALNGGTMAQLQAGWFDPLAQSGGADPRDIATLLMLTAVLALQSVLHGAGNDSRDAARALIRQALSSDLSGLPNQRALGRIVDAALAKPARATFWMVGVVLPDIARWSDLTDSVAAGGLERAVGDRLRSAFEPMGGRITHPASGRFVVMLGDRVDGIAIRQGLRRALGGQRFDVSDQSIHLRYHAGMVEVPAGAAVGADSVLAALSMSLQRAAADPTGIHRVTASAELLDGYRTELRTVELVSRAINEGRVRLFAERIEPVSPAPTEGLHFEVLVRVIDDEGKLLEPKLFLPAVWHAGLSSKLDRLVLVRTVAHLAAHPQLHAATRLCSINVAGPTLCDPEFPDFVKRALSTHRVDPQRLAMEITESSAIPDLELARAHVQRLADMGLSIALDDFGTGLATFDYLKRLHADILKIDGSFIRQIVDHPLDREIVSAIVRIARASGARTVAEWIETAEQRDIALALGVDYLQGRLIAHPVPIEQLELPQETRSAQSLSIEPVGYEHGIYASRTRTTRGTQGALAARAR
jgi:EAL domain-containing protein (putative c-di-GMP-specific phosphodiesterase class I)